MASVSLRNVTKKYSDRAAVGNLSLDVDSGELLVITGPAGCGKSTVLRLIAGLEEPDSGEIYIDGKPICGTAVKERDLVLVSAEFPVYKKSMSVYDNLAYGLKLRKVDSAEIDRRVTEAARLLGISGILKQKASSLEKGTLARVALCRGIVRRPTVLLLDEPLKGLGEKDRVQLMTEIVRLRSLLGTAVVCAIADDGDAMTLGTRVAVMKDGYLRQADTPKNLYDDPADTFVAAYLGTPPMNLFCASAKREGETVTVRLGLGEVSLTLPASKAKRLRGISEKETDVLMGVRAEDFHNEQLFLEASPETVIETRVRLSERLGGEDLLYLDIDGKSDFAIARVDARTPLEAGERVRLAIDANKIRLFDRYSGHNLGGIPEVNLIACKLLARADGALSACFGANEIKLPASVTSRILDRSIVNGDAFIGIRPDELFSDAAAGIALDAEADFVTRHADFTAVYCKVSGADGFVVMRAPKDFERGAGEKIKLYFDPEKLRIYGADGSRFTATRPVTNNTAVAAIEISGTRARAIVGKNKYEFAPSPELRSGTCTTFSVRPKAVSVARGGGTNVVAATVCDCDFVGKFTLLYLKLDGFEPYFTAAVDGFACFELGKKIKLKIDENGISTEPVQPLEEYIASKAQDAPPHVCVEEIRS